MTAYRAAALRWLWCTARRIENGEAVIREHVRRMHDRDRTNQDARGTPEYGSTRRLSDVQWSELCEIVARLAGRSAPADRARGPRGGRPRRESGGRAIYLVSPAEREYIDHLASLLGWSAEALDRFTARQTRGSGLRTHRDATAVIAPLERMCRQAGHRLTVRDRIKHWRRSRSGTDG